MVYRDNNHCLSDGFCTHCTLVVTTMKLTTKLKQLRLTIILKCNTNVPGHREGGGGGGGNAKKNCPWVYGPQNLHHRYISACACYAAESVSVLGVIFDDKFITHRSYTA